MTRFHSLPVVCLLACSAWAGPADELDDAHEAYAAGLQALSDDCAATNLLNDAERLLLEAAAWTSREEALTQRKASLLERRIALVRSSDRDGYRVFLKSKPFAQELEKLQRKERELRLKTVREFLEFAERDLKEGTDEAAVRALESAFALDPESDKLRRVAGEERLERLRANKARDHSLGRMTLGETLQGPQVTLADFEGKVVLWRSASL